MLNVTYNATHPASSDWRDTVRKFHQLWYDGAAGVPPWQTTTWFGVPAQKCPMDIWMYQEIIHRTRPEVIIETGVRWGGSALYLAHLLDLIGGGVVLGVDITLALVQEATRKHPRITLTEASSTDPAVV